MAPSHIVFGRTCDRVTLMSYRIVALIGLCAWLVGWMGVTGAHAAEQIIVPFTCETDRSGVYARPSQPQSYAIIGEREAEPFTACASDGSDRCRTMMLHRFDIDCDGQRIEWPEFYAAISDATTGRARVDGDRLVVRVRPQRMRRRARSRFQPPLSRSSFLVEMPDGFAPLRGTVARFKGGRSSRNVPMRATRDPFSTPQPQPRPVAPTEPNLPKERLARAQAKPAVITPKKQPAKNPARRTVIDVPQEKPALKAAQDKPKVLKPTVTTAPKAQPKKPQQNAKLKSKKTEAPAAGKSGARLKVVKAPPVAASSQSLGKTEAAGKATTTPIIPKLLNGPKDPTANTKDADAKASGAGQPDSIADLLQKRGAQVRADADAETQSPPDATRDTSDTVSSLNPAASPTLANTLAVLGIVASLMLVFGYAAFRFLTPNSAPPLLRPRTVRTTALQAHDVQPAAQPPRANAQEPSLAGMAQTTVTQNAANTVKAILAADQNRPDPPVLKADTSKASPQLHIEKPQHTEPTLAPAPLSASASLSTSGFKPDEVMSAVDASNSVVSDTSASDFVAPQLTASPHVTASNGEEKTEPTLLLKSAPVPPATEKREPELPMPKLVAAQIKQPDFEESALLLPTTRQEALTALGVGESAGDDVIERVVAGLRQCWRPDESNDKAERKRRLQRMEQIETAWRIISEKPQPAASDDPKAHPN